jgi:vacuolar-type H+-ATPase subunit I/STV1
MSSFTLAELHFLVIMVCVLDNVILFYQIWNIFFSGRYIILLMGIFSIYTGFIYNDVFSRSLNIFGSSWTIDGYNISDVTENAELTLSPYTSFAKFNASPYPVGLDPVWQVILKHINPHSHCIQLLYRTFNQSVPFNVHSMLVI